MNEQALSVKEAIVSRRSIKKFNGQPVDEELIPELLADATWAPNHGSRNPWRFVVASGENYEEFTNVIRSLAIPNWRELDTESLAMRMDKFTSASAAIMVIVPEDVRQKERLEDFAAASTLIQNLMLLAWDKGVGTCWRTPAFLDSPKFRETLGVKDGERVVCMLQVGYYDVVPKARPRTPAEQLTTYFGE